MVPVTDDGVSLVESGVLVVREMSLQKLLGRSATQRVHLLHSIEVRNCILVFCLRRGILLICPYLVKIRRSYQGGPLAAIFVSISTAPRCRPVRLTRARRVSRGRVPT
jgi:hypothetical protein